MTTIDRLNAAAALLMNHPMGERRFKAPGPNLIIRGVTERLRRQESAKHAARVVGTINAALATSPNEYAFEVWRHLVRGAAHHMARLKAPANSVGVLAGAAVDILPAYEPEHQDARAALIAIY